MMPNTPCDACWRSPAVRDYHGEYLCYGCYQLRKADDEHDYRREEDDNDTCD